MLKKKCSLHSLHVFCFYASKNSPLVWMKSHIFYTYVWKNLHNFYSENIHWEYVNYHSWTLCLCFQKFSFGLTNFPHPSWTFCTCFQKSSFGLNDVPHFVQNNHLLSYSAILLLYLSPPPGTASGQVLGTASFPSQSRLISHQWNRSLRKK